ncbi:hypothetical protein HW555_007938 [Spodoptera exigua]|uniref:FLYWCH-type domain-containing protein n=1 Tax=Spodoptera exigua TaxID=7107 RepID=A0A835L359_SPOEX|nr:hypothetical protein HW555_007938 [Spodoptera exigua]
MIGAYRYNMDTSSKGPKVRWYCTRYAYGLPVFSMTKGGNPVIMIGTYRYNRTNGCNGAKVRWYCNSLHLQPFTEAIFTTTKYGNPVIIFGPYRYNQASAIVSDRSLRPLFSKTKRVPVKWMMKKNRKELAMVNGFTFYCHKNNAKTKIWTCTSGWHCKARLITSSDSDPEKRSVITAKLEHNHPPPTYIITDGFYADIGLPRYFSWCERRKLCPSRLSETIILVKFVKRVNGKEVALVNGYTYYCRKQSLKKSTKIWNCTYGGTCHARMEITNHVKPSRRIVLSAKLEHKHEPSEYCISNGFLLYWVAKDNGKVLAVLNGYTFYLRRFHPVKSTWSCTQAGKCRARLMITSEKNVTDRVVVSARLDHNHTPPSFSISNELNIQWVKKINGKELAIVGGYTFYCHKQNPIKMQFVKKQDGKEIAIFNHYTFYCRQQTLKTASWVCTNSHRCKARIVMTNALEPWSRVMKSAKLHHTHPPPTFVIHDVRWVKKRDGKELVIFNQYTFYSHMKSMTTINWSCTSAGCKSRLITTNEDMPSQLQWIKKPNGKELIIVNQYTFYIQRKCTNTINWGCTYRGCKSRLVTTNEDKPLERQVLSFKETHAHPPPNYAIARGFYVKL